MQSLLTLTTDLDLPSPGINKGYQYLLGYLVSVLAVVPMLGPTMGHDREQPIQNRAERRAKRTGFRHPGSATRRLGEPGAAGL